MPVSARSVFSTAGLPAARRVERWESHNATALIGLDVHADGPLVATEVNVQLPQVRLARVRGSAHAVERTRGVIDRSPADSVAVYLTLRGEAWFTGGDGTRELRPGDVLACATDQPFARGFTRGLEELVVTVPCAALRTRADVAGVIKPTTASFRTKGAPGGTSRAAVAETRHYARALARLTGRATGDTATPPPDEGTVVDLVALLTAAGGAAAPATAHRAAARCYIEDHLTDPALGAEQIAAAIGISERQLSRVFAADDTSVPRYVLARRLRLAHSILAPGEPALRENALSETSPNTTAPVENVADVAARCGFSSAAYFSHAFRKHFGVRASELRYG